MERSKAFFGHQKLMAIPLDGYALLYGLIRSADPVAVQVSMHVNQFLHMGQNLTDHQIVFIKDMLRQGIGASAHDLCAEGAGMDGQHLVHP